MHQKESGNLFPIFVLHLTCCASDESQSRRSLISFVYSQDHGHAEVHFESHSDLLHCLYLLLYPLFSSSWALQSESRRRNFLWNHFHEQFQEFGYEWNSNPHHPMVETGPDTDSVDGQDQFILQAIEEIKENEISQNQEPCRWDVTSMERAEDNTNLLFQEAFLYPVDESPSFELGMKDPPIPNYKLTDVATADRGVSINKLSEGIFEMRTKSGVILEVTRDRPSKMARRDPLDQIREERHLPFKREITISPCHLITPELILSPSPVPSPATPSVKNTTQSSLTNNSHLAQQLDSDFSQSYNTPMLELDPHRNRKEIHVTKVLLQDPQLRVIGQVDQRYIMVYSNMHEQLLCVDQHAAHERVLLEAMGGKLSDERDKSCISSSCVAHPLSVTATQLRVLKNPKYLQCLKSWGFSYEITGVSLLLSSVPVVEGVMLAPLDFLEYVDHIVSNQSLPIRSVIPPVVERILASKACRSAIKFGDPLSHGACCELIQSLAHTSFPFQCAHGRPSIVPLFSFAQEH
jgi:DNA mismatch repair ATPase MutL